MLSAKVPWNLKAVAIIHILRLAVGLVIVRILYPILFTATSNAVELTDRLIVILLVLWSIKWYHASFSELGFTLKSPMRNIMVGLSVGAILLAVSIFSERIYSTVLFVTPSQHPLVSQVQQAIRWNDLIAPLFLAGVAAPIAEEVLYRMFTFLPLKDRWGLWGGAISSAAIFALMHFNAYWLAEMMVVGTGLALLYYYTGSLLSSIVAHSFINCSKIVMLFTGFPLT